MILPTSAPIAAADLPENWISDRREIIQRDGYALRPSAGCTIEVKSLRDNTWLVLTLPDKATAFTTAADRDQVLDQLTR